MDELTAGPAGEGEGEERPLSSAEQAEALVLRLVAEHADSLLRVARRHSICADDAQDAYQRGLEILMRHARRLDPERAGGWLHTVVRREAVALNRQRRRYLGAEEVDVDRFEARTSLSPEEAVVNFERVERSAAALKQLKPQELRALWLKALGHSYAEICGITGWTYTKTNRAMAEGRRSFLTRYAGMEAGEECQRLAPALSRLVDGEADAESLVELRAHLRHCLACKATIRHLHGSSSALTVVFPVAGLVVADVAEPASHFAVRLYEALVVGANERAANSVLRAQAVLEAATSTKMAAVAASAVAVTGGGLAVGQTVQGGVGDGARPALVGASAARLADVVAGAGASAHRAKPRASRRHRAVARTATASTRTASRTAAGTATRTVSSGATSTPTRSTTTRAASSGASAGGEFGFE
jgi:RNA polymerase sigma factor (sigma-70 family)